MEVVDAGRVPSLVLVLLLTGSGVAGCLPPPTTVVTSSAANSSSPGAPVNSSSAAASAEAGASPVAFDACALLPPAALAKVVGPTVDAGRAMPIGGWIAGQCAWSAKGAGFELSVGTDASIKAFNEPTVSDAKTKLASYRAQASGGGEKPKDVADIGDGAVSSATGMAAFKDGTYVEIRNLGLTEDQVVEIVRLVIAAL